MPALPFEEGMWLRGQHRLTEAKASFRQAVAERPDHAEAWFWLAATVDNDSQEEEAIPAYQRALEVGLPPDLHAKALTWLASSLAKTGRPAEAMDALGRAEAVGGYQPRAEYEGLAAAVRASTESR